MKIHQRLIALGGVNFVLLVIVSAIGCWKLLQAATASDGTSGVAVFLAASVSAGVLSLATSYVIGRSIYRPVMDTIKNLNTVTDDLSASASEIFATSESLAADSINSASSIEETSASLEEISSMTSRNAENTESAASAADGTRSTVTEVTHFMTELMTSMQEITKASKETEKVIHVIDKIAFQTNLLALNAAVEAAHTGGGGGIRRRGTLVRTAT